MSRVIRIAAGLTMASLGCLVVLRGQALREEGAAAGVPRLMQFTGVLQDRMGRPLTGVQGVTLALYRDQQNGAPLWLETQNVTADQQGRFAALLGATQREGLPLDLFTSGQAQWLGVQAAAQEEQPRILLTSVPYALVAGSAPATDRQVASISVSGTVGQSTDPGRAPITGVIAGTGLTGGGTSGGDVTSDVHL